MSRDAADTSVCATSGGSPFFLKRPKYPADFRSSESPPETFGPPDQKLIPNSSAGWSDPAPAKYPLNQRV
jgi:hypothetical protein